VHGEAPNAATALDADPPRPRALCVLHTFGETQTLEARGVSVLLTLLTGVLVPCTGVQPWTGLCCSFPATGSLT